MGTLCYEALSLLERSNVTIKRSALVLVQQHLAEGPTRSNTLRASKAPHSARSGRSLAEYEKALQMIKKDFRCRRCNKKLAEAIFTWLSIKCPRCGHLNTERAQEPR